MRLFYFREISFQNGRPLRVEKFRFFDVGLGEKLGNFLHRQEQTQGCLLERLKVKMTIEAFGSLILGVDNHGHGRNLLGGFQAAAQSVHEKEFPDALAANRTIHGQPAKPCDRQLPVAWKSLHHIRRQLVHWNDGG